MLRIIAGEFRSRKLVTPRDESISRPFAGRVKESVFNLLRGWFEEAVVLDLFAGVGTVGLEAISRGAARAYMVEKNRDVFQLLKRNIESLACDDRAIAIHGDALGAAALARVSPPVDLIFVDPPYDMMRDERLRKRVLEQIAFSRKLMNERGFVILRTPFATGEVDLVIRGFMGPEEHDYGPEMHVMLYSPEAALQETST